MKYPTLPKGKTLLDPAFEIARFIVWPLYPVILASNENSLCIDSKFHFTHLLALDKKQIKLTAEKWGCTIPEIDSISWQACDWEDLAPDEKDAAQGTGSRIRIVTPQPQGTFSSIQSPHDLAELPDRLASGAHRMTLGTFTEPHLPSPSWRYQCLVNGIRIFPGLVPSSSERDCRLTTILEYLPLLPGAGAFLWIDLRGNAMPRLRADRSLPVSRQLTNWENAISKMYERWLTSWPEGLPTWAVSLTAGGELSQRITKAASSHGILLPKDDLISLAAIWTSEQSVISRLLERLPGAKPREIPRDIGVYRNSMRTCTHSLDSSLEASLELATCLNSRPAIKMAIYDSEESFRTEMRKTAPLQGLSEIVSNSHSDAMWKSAFKLDNIPETVHQSWKRGVQLHVCSEALWGRFQQIHPIFEELSLAESKSKLNLIGPLQFTIASDSKQPEWMSCYDITFPFTLFAMNCLRRLEPEWLEERAYRNVFMLPFLLGKEPDRWRAHLKKHPPTFKRLMLFMPNPDLYESHFNDFTKQEWCRGAASALWNLETGQLLYAHGIHTEKSLHAEGRPFLEWLKVES